MDNNTLTSADQQAESSDSINPSASNDQIEDVPGNNNILHLEIDTRRPEWWRNRVQAIEIIRAIETKPEFRNDFTKSVGAMRGSLIGLFKLEAGFADFRLRKPVCLAAYRSTPPHSYNIQQVREVSPYIHLSFHSVVYSYY